MDRAIFTLSGVRESGMGIWVLGGWKSRCLLPDRSVLLWEVVGVQVEPVLGPLWLETAQPGGLTLGPLRAVCSAGCVSPGATFPSLLSCLPTSSGRKNCAHHAAPAPAGVSGTGLRVYRSSIRPTSAGSCGLIPERFNETIGLQHQGVPLRQRHPQRVSWLPRPGREPAEHTGESVLRGPARAVFTLLAWLSASSWGPNCHEGQRHAGRGSLRPQCMPCYHEPFVCRLLWALSPHEVFPHSGLLTGETPEDE